MKNVSWVIVRKENVFNDLLKMEDGSVGIVFANNYIGIPFAKTFDNYNEAINYASNNFAPDIAAECNLLPLSKKYNEKISYIQLVKEGMGGYTGHMMESLPKVSKLMH